MIKQTYLSNVRTVIHWCETVNFDTKHTSFAKCQQTLVLPEVGSTPLSFRNISQFFIVLTFKQQNDFRVVKVAVVEGHFAGNREEEMASIQRKQLKNEASWKALQDFYDKNGSKMNMLQMFGNDQDRFKKFRYLA